MVQPHVPCKSSKTCRNKRCAYEQYYIGNKDKDLRRSGDGENHWSGPESLEAYSGRFICDTMHGMGTYRWRYRGRENRFVTYEGYFYCNRLHGYGTMSYPDGRTFNGLFCNDMRWGPGVESHAQLLEDVGLWRGTQLVRLAWKPAAPNVAPDFMSTNTGRGVVESHRIILADKKKYMEESNYALELLKQYGAEPQVAVEKWAKLYPKHCTDLESSLCRVNIFEQDYYKSPKHTLQEIEDLTAANQDDEIDDVQDSQKPGVYFAWNDSKMVVNMMKHSYVHDAQRKEFKINIESIISGPRGLFKPAGGHELDCRTLLMASYLGEIDDVAQLVNKSNVHPNITDIQGNSAIMYAVCGDQPDIIHFLVEAGAKIDSHNDSCCTPLGMALLRFTCTENDIPPSEILQAVLPPPTITSPATHQPPVDQKVFEWNITRQLTSSSVGGTLTKSPSKINRNISSKKIKSLLSIKDQPLAKRKTDVEAVKNYQETINLDESFCEDNKVYNDINRAYSIKITDMFVLPQSINPLPYIFETNDMVKDVEAIEEEQKKVPEKNPKKVSSKVLKDTIKPSKEIMWQSNEKEDASIDSAEKQKRNVLSKTMLTILQLLSDGADPRLVKCPQPALMIAATSNCPELIQHLVNYGADVNERQYNQVLGYSPLDMAISRPFTQDNLEMARAILECGADASHRLTYRSPDIKDLASSDIFQPGPNLLHAVIARNAESDSEEEIRRQLMELLLEHNCSPVTQFNGRSAVDVAMSKNIDLLEIFIKSPKTNLNSAINESNQTVLVKMFCFPFFKSVGSNERFQTLTNSLLFGADPLLNCQNGVDKYGNIFVFAKKTLNEMDSAHAKPIVQPAGKPDLKAKKNEKPKKDEKLSTKSMGRMAVDDVEDYRQAVELVTECARLLHIRWLQARLVKKLIVVIDKFKHRQWNMIIKELKKQKRVGLWLNPQRCLETWDILSTTRISVYNDPRVLRHLLCIVIFTSWKYFGHVKKDLESGQKLTGALKTAIETDVRNLLRQRRVNKSLSETVTWKLSYVKPELVKNGANGKEGHLMVSDHRHPWNTRRHDQKEYALFLKIPKSYRFGNTAGLNWFHKGDKFNVCFECSLPFKEEKILCTSCKLVSFCSTDCMKSNIKRANCHPCSEYLKTKYFSSPETSFTNDTTNV